MLMFETLPASNTSSNTSNNTAPAEAPGVTVTPHQHPPGALRLNKEAVRLELVPMSGNLWAFEVFNHDRPFAHGVFHATSLADAQQQAVRTAAPSAPSQRAYRALTSIGAKPLDPDQFATDQFATDDKPREGAHDVWPG